MKAIPEEFIKKYVDDLIRVAYREKEKGATGS